MQRFFVPNDNCSYPNLPGIDLPDNYHSPARGSSHYLWDDKSYQTGFSDIYPASTYDQFLSQVIPFAVVTSLVEGNQNNAIDIVCVTPNQTQSGAQAPGDRTPWEENTAVRWQVAGKLAMAMAGLVGSTLAL